MNICYFGLFDPEYERNRVLISGLRQNGVSVVVCASRGKGLRAYLRLLKQWWAVRQEYRFAIVGCSDTRLSVLLARFLFRCPVIGDVFYSLYDSYVFDRKLVSSTSVKAAYYWFMDWFYCILADHILLDTNAHIEYFARTFRINKRKFIRSFVGASADIFHPMSVQQHAGFHVLFFGNFIPLQGIPFIIRAAKLLEHEGVHFDVIGNGQTHTEVLALAKELQVQNVTFREREPIHELAQSIANTDVCLGIFGDTGKAQRVIPNKVYSAIAMAKPVITAETPAIRELLTDHEDVIFCRPADSEDLAAKIRLLRDNKVLCSRIAAAGHETYRKYCTPMIVGVRLLEKLVMPS